MYHALLTNRYLTSRVIPFIAVAAVGLCVALVIVVVSVMSGFLDMVRSSGRKLMGDVVVAYPVSGIPHYDRLIKRIEALPEAEAATPVVDSWGLLRMPYPDGPDKQTETVQFWGIEPVGFARVTGYGDTVFWKRVEPGSEEWQRLFADLFRKNWKVLLSELADDQKVELIWTVMHMGKEPAATDRDQVRARLPGMNDDQWARVFDILRFAPDQVKQAIGDDAWRKMLAHDNRLLDPDQVRRDGLTLKPSQVDLPGIALGLHVSEANQRKRDGTYETIGGGAYWWMPRHTVTLTTIPVTGGSISKDNAASKILQVVNEFQSGVFLIDDKRVLIPIEVAQELLHLDAATRVDDAGNELGADPAKATMVLVRAKKGVTPETLRDKVEAAYQLFFEELEADSAAVVKAPAPGFGLSIKTWEQQQAQFIGPVEKERELMRVLFSIVYLVCAGLVLSIFWSIVYEKTRDIGILRSIGASREGVLWIFTRYGMITGTAGSLLGLGLGYVIIRKINPIQDAIAQPPIQLALISLAPCVLAVTWVLLRGGARGVLWMGVNIAVLGLVGAAAFGVMRLLGVDIAALLAQTWEFALGAMVFVILGCLFFFVNMVRPEALVATFAGTLIFLVFLVLAAAVAVAHQYGGFVMWNPEVYYFSSIPDTPDWRAAWGTVFLAITFSVLGAAIAASKAADTDPVRALRYE